MGLFRLTRVEQNRFANDPICQTPSLTKSLIKHRRGAPLATLALFGTILASICFW